MQNQLAACQTTERDIIVLTDWMTARMIRLGWVQKLDKAKMPNVEKNLLKSLRGRPFDKNDEYAVPWQSGLTGMAYNGNVTGEIRTIDELLTRPDLKGKVTALSRDARHRRAWSCSRLGHDPSNFTDAQFDDAINKIKAGGRLRADPPVHRQRLRPRAGQGRHRRLHRVVRRRPAAQRGGPEGEVRRARTRA